MGKKIAQSFARRLVVDIRTDRDHWRERPIPAPEAAFVTLSCDRARWLRAPPQAAVSAADPLCGRAGLAG
jgi:hypothetical protein